MAFSIKNERTDHLARELTELTGETLTEAVTVAVQERLERERARVAHRPGIADRLRALAAEVASFPVYDERTSDEIIGYDDDGLPT
jgi:antitoxin VapB